MPTPPQRLNPPQPMRSIGPRLFGCLVFGAWALGASPLAWPNALTHSSGVTTAEVVAVAGARPTAWPLTPQTTGFDAGQVHAQAASGPTTAQPDRRKGTAKRSKKAKPAPPSASEESRSDRERRLLRECAGRPNAGACEGYTR